MWAHISTLVTKYRVALLLLVLGITAFMAYHAKDVQLAYEIARVVPDNDSDYQAYLKFKETFGQDGTTMVLGVKKDVFFSVGFFTAWKELTYQLGNIEGVDEVLSIFDARRILKDSEKRAFYGEEIFANVVDQKQLDSLVLEYRTNPLYHGTFFNFESNTAFMAIRINNKVLASRQRYDLIDQIIETSDRVLTPHDTEAKFSGLPFIRTSIASAVKTEMQFFSVLSLIMCAGILLLFFRAFTSVVFPIVVIAIIVIWALGTVSLFDFRINAVTSLIPPLIIIIGVPNFIYLVNKFHSEYRKHGNKLAAIHRMVQKIGVVTFMTNATTAVGFLVLAYTKSPMLREFGLVAGINILATFFVSIIVVPAFFSYLPEPNQRHTHYLDRRWMEKLTRRLVYVVLRKRNYVYAVTIILIATAVAGAYRLRAIGYVLDDVPKEKKVYKDLKFFENNFGGVLPFEVVITANDPKGINNLEVLERMSIFQDTLESLPHLSRTYSVADVAKASRMAFFNNNPDRWGIPNSRERSYILPYLQNSNENAGLLENLVDSTGQIGRISFNIADIGSVKTTELLKRLTWVGNQVFDGQATVSFTGVSLLYIKNNEYLIKSLINSMLLAFGIISLLMGFMFKDVRMVLASLIPNLIPLLVTAGIMGFVGIPLKPSTVLVFSIAFGISVDDALHFLAKYRQELNQHNWPPYRIISVAITETGPSMMYTSIVLFAGFSIFALSDFGGTAALGYLLSITLLVAMFTNLIVLPSLILTFLNRKGRPKAQR